jgi:hypothetical protein
LKGVVYLDDSGKEDDTRRFLTWEDWVEWHDREVHGHGKAGPNDREMTMLKHLGVYVREQLAPLKERIEQLEQTLQEFGYRGTWQEGIVYRAGNFVTLGGSLWHCNANETTSRPNTESSGWSLAVKRGRDGRSAA